MPAFSLPLPFDDRAAVHRFDRWAGWLGGFVLPVVAALLYRTYHVTVASADLEITRQIGIVYLAGEVATFLHARRRGLDLAALWGRLGGRHKALLLLFVATFWISSVVQSRMVPFSLALSLGWIVHLLFAASVYHLAKAAPAIDMRAVAGGFVAGLVALAMFVAVHFAAVPTALAGSTVQFGQREGIDLGSAIPGFISSRLFGAWCGAVLALMTGIAWRHDGGRGRDAVHLALALALCLTFWTATRAALLGWAVALAVAWTLAGRPVARATWTRLPFHLAAAIALALLLPPYGNAQFSFFRVGGLASADAVASGRLALWATALRVAADHPLLGSGAGSSWWLVSQDGFYHVQPHNAVIQFVLNWGLVPTVPALLLLGAATWRAHRIVARRPGLLPALLMLDCLLAMSLFDGMLHFAQFVMLIFGCLALCLAREDA